MKKLFFVAFFSCSVLISTAQDAGKLTTAAPATTVAQVEESLKLKEEQFDFGKIPQGKPVTHIFDVVNIGTTPITIANVQASCGCTTPEWDKDTAIPAGGSTKITVGYNAAAEGPFNKLVTVTYGENQSKQITIKGEVWKTPASSAPVNESLNDLKN